MFLSAEAGLPLEYFIKSHQGSTDQVENYLFVNARNGLKFFLTNYNSNKKKTLLIPSYICIDFIETIQVLGYDLKFYEIDEKFQPVKEDIIKNIDDNVFAIVLVHFFGYYCEKFNPIIQFCRKNGISVIEDFAHVLYSKKIQKRVTGDIAIFSLKKLFPLADGGLLYRGSNFTGLKNKLYKEIPESANSFMKIFKLLLKFFFQKIPFLPRKSYSKIMDRDSVGHLENLRIEKISKFSRKIFYNILNSRFIERCSEIRRKNFNYFMSFLTELKDDLPLFLPFRKLNENDIPYFFPLRINIPVYHLVDNLRQKGIPVITWPELDKRKENFENAEYIRSHYIFFPLHENFKKKQIKYMVNKFRMEYEKLFN